jgi:type I restriction enzyme M protein
LVNAVDFFTKMRKSLGNKRNLISDDQIAEIVRVYGAFEESEHSKIFDNEDFGYRKITVERPLRLSLAVTPERLAALEASKAFESLATSKKKGKQALKEIEDGTALQQALLAALRSLPACAAWKDRRQFLAAIGTIAAPVPVRKAILAALGERDETAEICRDEDGDPEPDPDLRDTENVPLKEDVRAYFEREVQPHVPDAWIDESKTKVGYEIPLTRHFYKYTPPRPLEEIAAGIRILESEIVRARAEVAR